MKPSIAERIAAVERAISICRKHDRVLTLCAKVLATLSQHEALERAVAEMEAAHQNCCVQLVLTYKGRVEALEAVADAARTLGQAMNDCLPSDAEFSALWDALAALDAAETEKR